VTEPPFPTEVVRSALLRLIEKLDATYTATPANEADRRAQLIITLKVVADFLAEFRGIDDPVNRAFHTLANGLDNLNGGIQVALLKPEKRHGRPPDSHEAWLDRSAISLAFTIWTRTGLTQDEAIARVLRHHWTADVIAGRDSDIIKGWTFQLRAGLSTDEIAVAAFRTGIETIDTLTGNNVSADMADRLLAEHGKRRR
jgi:hypothetical protein